MANVEAHITGTVWMEMPVEAEDEGRVAEILCQEGQSVSEGDALVVLE